MNRNNPFRWPANSFHCDVCVAGNRAPEAMMVSAAWNARTKGGGCRGGSSRKSVEHFILGHRLSRHAREHIPGDRLNRHMCVGPGQPSTSAIIRRPHGRISIAGSWDEEMGRYR